MAAHKYWRLFFTISSSGTPTNPNASDIWLDEVVFANAAGTDLCVGGTPMSGGDWSADYPASQAFDKTTTTDGWSSPANTYPCWIGYNFPSPVDVAYVDATTPSESTAPTQIPTNLGTTLQWSDDGVSWTPVPGVTTSEVISGLTTGNNGEWWSGQVRRLKIVPRKATLLKTGLVRGWAPTAPLPLPQQPRKRSFYGDSKNRYYIDFLYGVYGGATISGKVTIENIPGSRRVRLFDKISAALIREMWSAPDGRYSFKHLDPNREYFVLAHDHLRVHNAVIQDMIDPP